MQPGEQVGRYVVEALLGEGGGGVVYRVRHAGLGTRHALKLVGHLSPEARERFLREARVQARLRHPGIVRVTHVFEVLGQPAIVAEYVDGPDLATVLRDGPLAPARALRLFGQIVDAVGAAHADGVVHRDLKPHNVLLARGPEGEQARVTDFGIAGLLRAEDGDHLTRTGVTLGTPDYMAPEQALDAGRADERSDIWSLGCMLYELLSGRRPFAGCTGDDLTRARLTNGFPRLDTLVPALPTALVVLVHACLSPDPRARPASCAAVQAVLASPAVAGVLLAETTPPPRRPARVPEHLRPAAPSSPRPPDAATPPGADTLTLGRPDAPEPPARRARPGLRVAGALAVGTLIALVGARWRGGGEAEDAPPTLVDPGSAGEVAPVPAEVPAAEVPAAEVPAAEAPAAEAPAAEPPAAEPPAAEPPAAEPPAAERPAAEAPPAAPLRAEPPAAGAPSEEAPSEEAPAGAATARVVADPGTPELWLAGDDGRLPPGAVPPGHYELWARFPDQGLVQAGYVSLRAGEAVQIACDPAFAQCRARRR